MLFAFGGGGGGFGIGIGIGDKVRESARKKAAWNGNPLKFWYVAPFCE